MYTQEEKDDVFATYIALIMQSRKLDADYRFMLASPSSKVEDRAHTYIELDAVLRKIDEEAERVDAVCETIDELGDLLSYIHSLPSVEDYSDATLILGSHGSGPDEDDMIWAQQIVEAFGV